MLKGKERIAVLMLAAATLAGCASTAEITAETNAIVNEQWRVLAKTEACCSDVSRLDFAPLGAEGLRFQLAAGAAREFGQDKSYFRGVELGTDVPEWLVIKSHMNLPRRNGLPWLVRPSYLVLDKDYSETARVLDVPLCYAQGWGQLETGYFGLVRLDSKAASKLVVYTSPLHRGSSVPYHNSGTTAGGGAVVEVTVNYNFPAGPTGELELLPLSEKLREHLDKKCPQLFVGAR